MLPFPLPRRRSRAALAALVLAAAACSDSTGPAPVIPVTRSITVNAAAGFTYLALDTLATAVTVADPRTSSAWDIGFFATTVTLDGGQAGPGGVRGYCLCRNAGLTNTQVAGLTAAGTQAAFDSVSAASIPADSLFVGDVLAPAIAGWYSGTPGPAVTPTANRAWIVLKGSGASTVLGKFAVTGIQNPTATSPGTVTIQFALETAPGAAFGPVQTMQIATAGAPVYVNLTTAAVSTSADWDLTFDGYAIKANGGVSGTGTIRAVLDTTTAFATIDAAYAFTAPPQAFRADAFSGAFGQHPWYRYNITGTDNQIWPLFNTYLVRRGTTTFKVELTGYYASDGTARQITVRYAKLTN